MGVLLGGFVEADPDRARGRHVVPRLRRARPGRRARDADRGRRDHLPRHGDDQVAAGLLLDDGDAARRARRGRRPPAASCCSGWSPRARCSSLVLAPFGVFETWWGVVAGVLRRRCSSGWRSPRSVYARQRAHAQRGAGSRCVFRLGVFPMFLFSGAFFPISNLGPVLEWVARLTPLWHGVDLSRMFTLDTVDWTLAAVNVLVPGQPDGGRLVLVGLRADPQAGGLRWPPSRRRTARTHPPGRSGPRRRPGCCSTATTWSTGRPGSCSSPASSSRCSTSSRSASASASSIDGFEFNGQPIPYAEFVAPGDAGRLGHERRAARRDVQRLLQAQVRRSSTTRCWPRRCPRGTWPGARSPGAWLRGGIYSAAFLVVMAAMGLVGSWWAVLALPAALLIGFAFAAVGMALTTYMKQLAGLRQDHAGPAADVPVLGDVLPGHGVRRLAALGGRGDAALPRCRAVPRADHRRAVAGRRRSRSSTWSRWAWSGSGSCAAGSARLLLT